mmetsp:Transcript_37468/g.75612  ORF Transcript_37468/g.75612 Transcript_37468/m.75612 type:complete len:212 (-) Transcript_37468:58-693(-)
MVVSAFHPGLLSPHGVAEASSVGLWGMPWSRPRPRAALVAEDMVGQRIEVPISRGRATCFEEEASAASKKMENRMRELEAEADSDQAAGDLMNYSAREHAIHEAWKHAQRSNELAKEAAEASLESANESMQARRMLDQHDVIGIESQTQADVRKEEIARGLAAREVPLPLLALPPTTGRLCAGRNISPSARCRRREPRFQRWRLEQLRPFL